MRFVCFNNAIVCHTMNVAVRTKQGFEHRPSELGIFRIDKEAVKAGVIRTGTKILQSNCASLSAY